MQTNVYYAPILARNIIISGKLDEKSYDIKYLDGMRAGARRNDDQVVFDVARKKNVLIVKIAKTGPYKEATINAIVATFRRD